MNRFFRHAALALGAFAASLGATACAQQHTPTPQAEQLSPAPATVRPAMWRVADEDTTIYLFGTVHALPDGIDWFDGHVANAFEGSQELITEIVESEAGGLQAAVASKAVLPAGKTLRDMLSPSERAAFEKAMTASGLPVGAFDRFKPWFAAVNLSALPMLKEGFRPDQGVEHALDARAKALGRPHSALETAEYQLGLFDSLPMNVQLRYLNEVVNTLPDAKGEIARMIDAWKIGDADKLAEIMNEDTEAPELMELLLTNRNRAWAAWIDERLDRPGTVFMAVGAGHLAGAGSVQDQLRARGIGSQRLQ